MYDELSEADIQKMKEEIEHRKVVVRKEALAAVKEAREPCFHGLRFRKALPIPMNL